MVAVLVAGLIVSGLITAEKGTDPLLPFLFGESALAGETASIRLYRLNKKGQLINQRWVGDTDEDGCHDLRGFRKVHRFAQVGYAYCELFQEHGCSKESQVTAMWHGRKYRKADIDITQPQERLLPGSLWYLDPEKNVEISSWSCQYQEIKE
jgi:hypothetical protein